MTADLFMGIDPSAKKIAVVMAFPLLGVSEARAYPLYLKGQTKQDVASMGRALDAMVEVIGHAQRLLGTTVGNAYAWVEDPLIGRGGALTTMKQAYIGGIIRATLASAGFNVYGVNVSTWKKQVCGSGRAEKADVARVVKIRWPKVVSLLGGDGDLTDAAAICLHAQDVSVKAERIRTARPTPGGVSER